MVTETKTVRGQPSSAQPSESEAANIAPSRGIAEHKVKLPTQKFTFNTWHKWASETYKGRGGVYGLARASLDGADVAPKKEQFLSLADWDRARRSFTRAKQKMADQRIRLRRIERTAGPRPSDTSEYYYKPAYKDGKYSWEKHYRSEGGLYSIDPVTGERIRYKRKANLGEVQVYTKEGIKTVYTHPDVPQGMSKFISGTSRAGYQIDTVGALESGYSHDNLSKLGVSESDIEKAREAIPYRKEFERILKDTSPELYSLYKSQGIDSYNAEVKRRTEDFRQRHIIIGNKAMLISEWNKLPEKYQSMALRQGFDAITEAIELDNRKYIEFQNKLKSGEIIALPDNKYVERDKFKELPEGTQQILLSGGFEKLEDIQKVTYYDTVTGEELTGTEYRKIVEKDHTKIDDIVLSPKSGKRLGVKGLSFIAPPAKALLPEFTGKDISAIEWGLGVVNVGLLVTAFAPGALLTSTAGKATVLGLSATGSGLLGFEVGRHWNELSDVEKGVGVAGTLLYALPALTTVARGIKVSSVKIPTAKGEVTSWKGLSVAQRPVIGKSGGKWVVGARSLTIPEARLILDGYHPGPLLETKVFVNTKALRKAGFSETQIDYLTLTLKDRNLFAGKKSAFITKEELIKPTEYVDADEIQVFLRTIGKYNKKIKQVDMVYGSATMKAQIDPKLRQWRGIHDWDIATTMSADNTAKFAREILNELNKIASKRQYRINPEHPTLIEKRIGNQWKHIADIHSHEVVPTTGATEIPSSKLDATGQYSYGRLVAEPALTLKYPNIGRIDIMRLSESGVRKADTLLRVRQVEGATALRPPERGISAPGVPKDAADFYVILRTYEEGLALPKGTADEWAKAWAKAMGYTEAEIEKVLPRITKAFRDTAQNTPSDFIGYRFYPSIAKSPANAVPQVIIHIPSSLYASVSNRPSLAKTISQPINPYSIASSSRFRSLIKSASVPKYLSSQAPYSKVIYSKSPVPSPSVVPSPYSLPSPYPSPMPSPSLGPSPYPSPIPSPSPVPTPVPTPESIPVPKPVPTRVIKVKDKKVKGKRKQKLVPITWRQGFVWWVIHPPYASKTDVQVLKNPPTGARVEKGIGSAYKTIQALGGKADILLTLDMGIMDIEISKPREGDRTKIKFKRDIKQKTIGDIKLQGVRV